MFGEELFLRNIHTAEEMTAWYFTKVFNFLCERKYSIYVNLTLFWEIILEGFPQEIVILVLRAGMVLTKNRILEMFYIGQRQKWQEKRKKKFINRKIDEQKKFVFESIKTLKLKIFPYLKKFHRHLGFLSISHDFSVDSVLDTKIENHLCISKKSKQGDIVNVDKSSITKDDWSAESKMIGKHVC